MKLVLTQWALKHPRSVLLLVLLLTGILGAQMPKVHFDNDPENMLAHDEPVRLFHHQVKDTFSLYDFVVVGIVNEHDPDGIFNVETLDRIYNLTGALMGLRRGDDGLPVVSWRDGAGESHEETLDLRPDGAFKRALNVVFRHDPNRLFDAEGRGAIIAHEILSPSVVDNIKQAELGSLKLGYLMEHPPENAAEARTIRDDAMNNPLYNGTLVSEDGKALCIYLPIRDKTFSYNVASLVKRLTADWGDHDAVYVTGLPVAEDTFGVEMLVQMATSAPLAGVAIFLLMFLFFRRIKLIIAPMIVAGVSIITTMGLLIGLGYDVHIMSSMIAIFLMPIAVADAIHILSEFYDTYPRFKDKAATLRHVVGHLFSPMLYTSLTTMVGFASLATTPIPPVRVFGLHVAFGVGMAWFLTMTLVPAYVMLFVSDKSLDALPAPGAHDDAPAGLLERVGAFSFRHARSILAVTVLLVVVAVYGITRIRVNDNPVNWFSPNHEIRVADRVLNAHFGGTYTAYLTFKQTDAATRVDVAALKQAARADLADLGDGLVPFLNAVDRAATEAGSPDVFFDILAEAARERDAARGAGWQAIGDEVNFLEPEGLTRASLARAAAGWAVPEAERTRFIAALDTLDAADGPELQEAALTYCDAMGGTPFADFTRARRLDLTAPAFKRPEVLAWLKGFEDTLASDDVVGKTTTVVDALEKASYEMLYRTPAPGEDADVVAAANRAAYAVPGSVGGVAQVYEQLAGMKKKDSLFHLVSRDFAQANMWVQLKSGDNRDMERVVAVADAYLAEHPAPVALDTGWAGLTYINVAWQGKMVKGMLSALVSSFFWVLLMMVVLFRSPTYGVLAMIPLTVTITLIYGLIGLVGKEYDMPIAVLSSLTLGLSVDFAIHFLQRARELQKTHGSWQQAIRYMFREPATAISRNAVTISVGFTPLLAAPLIPYKTVGFFLATIMAVSWLATLLILAALVTVLRRRLFGETS